RVGYGRAMNRTLLILATASVLALGCGTAALDPATPTTPAAPPATLDKTADAPAAKADTASPDEAKAPAATPAATTARKVGDFVVYRFSGTFRRTPLTLTERVVARQGSILTIDITADDGKKHDELRVRIDESFGAHAEVKSVAKLDGGVEKPASMDVYEALMARTALAADENEAALGT